MSSRTKLLIAGAGVVVIAAAAVWWVRYRKDGGDDKVVRAGASAATGSSMRRVSASGPGVAAVHEDDPAGELVLEGQVVDANEAPVAGARVAIDSNPPREDVSEKDGSFSFDHLVGRDYEVVASTPNGSAGPVTARLTADSEPIILRMKPAGTLSVSVVDAASGTGIAGATVEVRATLTTTGQTGADGVVAIAGIGPAWAVLHVSAAGYAPIASMLETTGDPEREQRHFVEMFRGAPVSGRVVDAAGAGVGGARVIADPASEPFPVVDPRRDGATTDADGRWSMPAIGAGTYRFVVTHASHAPATSPPISLDGVTERTGVVIALSAGVKLTGVVKTGGGKAVASASVRVATSGGGLAWHMLREVYTDAAGAFVIDGLPAHRLDVVASHDLGASALTHIDLEGKTTENISLVLDVTGTIAGHVVDSSGDTIAEAQVIAEPAWNGQIGQHWEWRVRGTPMIVSDAGGGFRFTGLPAGKYTLRATRPGVSTSSLWQSVGAVVSAGDLAVNLVLPDAGMLTGKVAFSEGGAPRMFTVAVGAGYPAAFAEKDGSFSIDAPGGKQTLFISGPDFMRAVHAVDVAEKQSTDVGTITVERGRSVAGRVVDQNGNAVEGATVVAGMMLSGSGAELNIESESYGSQQTTTDAAGRFLMTGFGEAPLVAVAQHADVGRSESVSILRSSRSAQVELVLVATGALKGVVRRDGKPLPGTVVIANPRAATRSNFFVVTGEDGSYALDKLAAGDYYVMAMIGGGGPKPKDMHFRAVDVAVGEIAERDIDIDVGDVTVAVTTTTDTGAPVMLAIVFVMTGTWDAPTSEALRNTFAEVETATVYLRNAMGPGAIDVAGLQPGPHTTCVTPIPADPSDMDAIQQTMQRADQLPMKCVQFAVTAAPTQQSVAVTVPTEWTKP